MNRYCNWADFGYLSSIGSCFDIGNTVASALAAYKQSGNPFSGPTEPGTAGNGSIMRLAPVVMYFHPKRELVLEYAAKSSRTTHGALECVEACQILAELLHRALGGASKRDVLFPVRLSCSSSELQAVADLEFLSQSASSVRGSGYVVESLEAALWCFSETDDFREAILLAANLGDDADTTAAICGQLAGAYYGMSGIPTSWLSKLVMADQISDLADRLRTSG
jgi:ADP-ribosyl-[dinitrogen reductase] hydrolase